MRDGSDQDQALCVARRRHYQYREVIDVLAGINFLGFPHVELNQVDQMDNIKSHFMFKTQDTGQDQTREAWPGGLSNSLSAIWDGEAPGAYTICIRDKRDKNEPKYARLLEESGSHFTCCVKHLVSWPRTIACCRAEMLNYVVGEQACCVKGDYETSLGIPETHDGICHTKHRGHLYEKVRELLRGIIVEAPWR